MKVTMIVGVRSTVAVAAVLLAAGSSSGDTIAIGSSGVSSEPIPTGANFSGEISYSPNGFAAVPGADLAITLTNTTSDPPGDGYITGFVFNFAGLSSTEVGSALSLAPDAASYSPFGMATGVSASPFGNFDVVVGIDSEFGGGGDPKAGIAVGETRTFYFHVQHPDPGAIVNASTFFSEDSVGGDQFGAIPFAVRFKSIGEASDKLVGGTLVPVPAAVWGGTALLASIGGCRLIRRRKD